MNSLQVSSALICAHQPDCNLLTLPWTRPARDILNQDQFYWSVVFHLNFIIWLYVIVVYSLHFSFNIRWSGIFCLSYAKIFYYNFQILHFLNTYRFSKTYCILNIFLEFSFLYAINAYK